MVWPAKIRAKREPAALDVATLTLGCRIPYPSVTRPQAASKRGLLSGWAMIPMSFRAASRGRRVSVSSVMQ